MTTSIWYIPVIETTKKFEANATGVVKERERMKRVQISEASDEVKPEDEKRPFSIFSSKTIQIVIDKEEHGEGTRARPEDQGGRVGSHDR